MRDILVRRENGLILKGFGLPLKKQKALCDPQAKKN